jgi:hypothetical protein
MKYKHIIIKVNRKRLTSYNYYLQKNINLIQEMINNKGLALLNIRNFDYNINEIAEYILRGYKVEAEEHYD